MAWQKREIENYLCCRQVLLDYAASTGAESSAGPLFEAQEAERRRAAIHESIAELERAQEITGRPAPFSDDAKASDDFLDPLFRNYYRRLGLPDLMQKTDYHVLAALMPAEAIAQEVGDKLDAILAVARAAKPTEG